MFGLTFEKIIIIGVIAAVIIGPQRLPGYARHLADLVRSFRSFVDVLKTRTEAEIGVPLNTTEWNAKLREYDPRTIVKHALNDDPLPHTSSQTTGGRTRDGGAMGNSRRVLGTSDPQEGVGARREAIRETYSAASGDN